MPTTTSRQAEAYEQHGAKAFQVPLTAKPRLYDALLEAAHSLPVRALDRSIDRSADRSVGVHIQQIQPMHFSTLSTQIQPMHFSTLSTQSLSRVRSQTKPAVSKLSGKAVELVALDGEDDAVLQGLFDISDGSARCVW